MAADDVPGESPDSNPFANLPLFGDLAKALSGQGPLNWDAARQFAALSSTGNTGGSGEGNVEPTVRIAYERLVPIVEMHVRDVTGIEHTAGRLELTTPGVWAIDIVLASAIADAVRDALTPA